MFRRTTRLMMINIADTPPKASLLFLSLSDGSDPRINKEVTSLARRFAIDFVGVMVGESHPFIAGHTRRMEVVKGRRRSLPTLVRLAWRVLLLLARNRYDSVHVINENLYLVLWPLLIGQHVVLDIFDSMFLKSTMPNWLANLGMLFCYALPAKIIVTDEERAALMPAYTRSRHVILPNYPFRYAGPSLNRDPEAIRILYAGSLGYSRGTSFLQALLAVSDSVRIVMAGWIWEGDEQTQALSRHPQVEWMGVLPQHQIIEQATRCDFILCHYDPSIKNNIYASPNKIYDAIQAGTAVIINPEVRIARFVQVNKLGVVLDAYAPADMKAVAGLLDDFKANYRPDPALRKIYLWDAVEGRLLAAHDPSTMGAKIKLS